MKDKIVMTGLCLMVAVISIMTIYGCYWLVKNISYQVFYEDMVKQTITETVNPEALK